MLAFRGYLMCRVQFGLYVLLSSDRLLIVVLAKSTVKALVSYMLCYLYVDCNN